MQNISLPFKVFFLFNHPAEPHDHQLFLFWSAGERTGECSHRTKNNQVTAHKDMISKLKTAVAFADDEYTIVQGSFLYLTKWGKASSLQKDRETKRTPAGVAGGRLVIN